MCSSYYWTQIANAIIIHDKAFYPVDINKLGWATAGWKVLHTAAGRMGKLVGCLTARQNRKVNLCQLWGGKPAQSAKDGKRDTTHITLCYTITM